ncbi:MAG TPA: VOC family protein [Acidimicrobiia bacterium]|nr:VOC family protein [Acidimicrobiia bacterium]
MPALVALDVAADPDAWRALGFAVDDDDVCAVEGVAIRLGSAGRKISGWALADVPGGVEVDGLPIVPPPQSPPVSSASHPNGTVAVDHLVVMSPDPDRTTKALAAHGVEPRRQRHTDQYGPPFTQTFFRLGRPILELIGPATPAGSEPARFYGVAFTVGDLDATAALLGDRLGRVKEAVQPGRRIATLRREAGAGIPLAFMSSGADSLDAGTSGDDAQ